MGYGPSNMIVRYNQYMVGGPEKIQNTKAEFWQKDQKKIWFGPKFSQIYFDISTVRNQK